MTSYLRIFILLIIYILSCGWGYNGHKIINKKTVLTFPPEMEYFRSWQQQLEAHASDADNRKGTDPTEGPKHYIDIDNYPDFINNGFITQDFDSLAAQYGYNFVMDQGILPWAAITTYDSLVQCMSRMDWTKGVLFAADLGHYIGDSHMPLHLTRNYNGQYTGQTGIHSRYESNMINRYYTGIDYLPGDAETISDVSDYIFQIIYNKYDYIDSLLAADLAAKAIAGNTTSDLYYQKLWEFTREFTIELFRSSSNALGSLIYSAWIEAGRPGELTSGVNESDFPVSFNLFQNYPNPFNPSTTISYSVASPENVSISVYSLIGELVAAPVYGFHDPGTYTFTFSEENLPAGVYFYTATAGAVKLVRKMILLK
jgi:hypothetical protein